MGTERDKRINGEYDPPLPKRSRTPSKEVIAEARKILKNIPA